MLETPSHCRVIVEPSQLSSCYSFNGITSQLGIKWLMTVLSLRVAVKTDFLRLSLITRCTLTFVRKILPLFYKRTPTRKSFVLKYSLGKFSIWCCLGVLASCCSIVLAYRIMKGGSWKKYVPNMLPKRLLQNWKLPSLLKYFIPLQRPVTAASPDILY